MSNQWKMVPVEPTDEMVEAAWDSDAADYVGEHKRIWQLGMAYKAMLAAAPVPSAGDVEVLERARKIELLRGAFEQRFKLDIWPVIDWLRNAGLDDRAHITRLTAERDGLLVKLAEETDRVRIAVEYQHKALRGRDRAQSELTKARELMSEFCERVENGEVRSKRTYANFKSFLAHQSAPAAKGGE